MAQFALNVGGKIASPFLTFVTFRLYACAKVDSLFLVS